MASASRLSGLEILEHGLPPHLLADVHHHHLHVAAAAAAVVLVAAADVRAHEAGGYGPSGRGQRPARRAVAVAPPLIGAAVGEQDGPADDVRRHHRQRRQRQLAAATDRHGRRDLGPAAVRDDLPAAMVPQQRWQARRGEDGDGDGDGRRAVPVPGAGRHGGAEAAERRARGPVHGRGEQPGGAPRQRGDGAGGGHGGPAAVGGGGRRGILPGELEDLEAVLGDGDAHAEEELVVHVAHVGGAELVAREHQRVLERHVRVHPRPAEPRVPVHSRSGGAERSARRARERQQQVSGSSK